MTIMFRLDDEAAVHANLEIFAEQGDLPPGSLTLLLADAGHRLMMAVVIDDVPSDPPQDERIRMLAPLLRQLPEHGDVDGVLMVVARDGSTQIDGGDLAWYDAFVGPAQIAHLTSHGVYLATPSGVRRVRPGTSRAA